MKVLAQSIDIDDGVKFVTCAVEHEDGTFDPPACIRFKLPDGDQGKSIETSLNDPKCRLYLEVQSHEVDERIEYTILAVKPLKTIKVLTEKIDLVDGVKFVHCVVEHEDTGNPNLAPAYTAIRMKLPDGGLGEEIETMVNDPECVFRLQLEERLVNERTEYKIFGMSAVK